MSRMPPDAFVLQGAVDASAVEIFNLESVDDLAGIDACGKIPSPKTDSRHDLTLLSLNRRLFMIQTPVARDPKEGRIFGVIVPPTVPPMPLKSRYQRRH